MSAISPSRSERLDASASKGAVASIKPPRGFRRRPPRWHAVAEAGIKVVALAAIAAIVLIFVFIAVEAIPIFTSMLVRQEVTPGKMTFPQAWDGGDARYSWQPVGETPKYSILPLVVGTLKVTFVSLVIAAPIAILAAIYVSHIARPRVREILKPTIELLAGVPSVVLGVFALIVMGTILQKAFGFEHRLNTFLAGCALALALVPLIFTIAEDALSSVPKDFLDASLALGATRAQTITRVVVPAAVPGIAAGVVLGFGRAVGETMIVLMASGNAALIDGSLGHSTRTITATIAQEMGEVVHGSAHYVVLFVLAAVLLDFTLITNAVAQRIVEHFRRARGGS